MRLITYDNHHIYAYGSSEPLTFLPQPSVVTVGSYDGVHCGHRVILSRLVEVAHQNNLRSVVVTFEPHPRTVLKGALTGPLGLLTTLEEKSDLLAAAAVDLLFVVRFTHDFAARTSDDFIRNVLVGLLGAERIIVGYDHAFGRDRSGSHNTLERLGNELHFGVEVIDEVLIGNEHLSSTRIRKLLQDGRIEEVNEFLGSPYLITGRVVQGAQLGRTIGFPTVNLQFHPAKLLPRYGVYFARTMVQGVPYMALMNIGKRPTVSSNGDATIEAHLLGFEGSLYGEELRFSILRFIRDEKRFASLEALQEQLEKDKKAVEMYLE